MLIEVHLADLFAVNEICGLKILDFAGKLSFELMRIKALDGSGTAHAVEEAVPSFFDVVPHRGEGAKAGNDYSFEFHK